jgi:hypothetical protein
VKDRLLRLFQLALAALISAAAGGLILPLLLFLAELAAGAAAAGKGTETPLASLPVLLGIVIFGGGMAVVVAIGAGWPPAFVAGTVLSWAGRSRFWARSRLAWAVAGAAAALVCYFRAFPPGGPDPSGGRLALSQPVIAGIFMLTGALAGQVYRSALAATAPFFGFEDDPDDP